MLNFLFIQSLTVKVHFLFSTRETQTLILKLGGGMRGHLIFFFFPWFFTVLFTSQSNINLIPAGAGWISEFMATYGCTVRYCIKKKFVHNFVFYLKGYTNLGVYWTIVHNLKLILVY